MANLKEQKQWEEFIYQLSTSDPVLGGENGVSNKPLRQLANRTLFLKDFADSLQKQIDDGMATGVVLSHDIDNTSKDLASSAFATATLNQKIEDSMVTVEALIGIPLPYPSKVLPKGFLAMKGQTISKAKYPKLFKLYGNRLPDLRDEFIRGCNDKRGLLSKQQDAIRNIKGDVGWVGDREFGGAGGAFAGNQRRNFAMKSGASDKWTEFRTFDASRVVPTADENRPRNIGFLYICLAG
ncbi:MAG: hypothetical protein CR974_04085 [Gammaproteobacteria bacterium]|nr:MAG: hypothetical protein CR974_04085 [Gammaproteobacteria bacterium]